MIQKILGEMNIPWIIQILIGFAIIMGIYFFLRMAFKNEKVSCKLGKYPIISLAVIACVQFCQLEIANHNVFFKNMSVVFILINILTLFMLSLLLYAITNRGWLSIIVQETAVTILGIANYYTLHFRGTPVTAQDIPSIKTAVNVSADLKFTLQIVATFLAVVAVICILYAFCFKKAEVVRRKQYWQRGLKALISFIFFWLIYFSELSPKPANTSTWIWRDQYWKYGYTACSIESVQRAVNIIEKPEAYSVSAAVNKMNEYMRDTRESAAASEKPDIILILNETFYDFSLIHDFTTNEPVTPYLDSLENTIRGYVSVPTIGGGTNRSEYELLTSNSLYLMKDILPFWSLNMTDANSVVTALKEQGYYTMAFHQGTRGNYNRDKKYVEMGFDDVYFADDMESYELVHGNISDKSGYEYLIQKYEERDQSVPFFAFNLTMQNHISYREMETSVHVTSGFKGMEEQADTYLSCLRASDEAFEYLTSYFSDADRPVLICMLGDHGPDYAADVEKKTGLSETVQKYGEKCTPLYIWSNYGLDEEDWGIISMPYVVPRLLEEAELPISSYYRYLADMSGKVPILTAYDSYGDEYGVIHSYKEDSAYQELILDYWYFEYYNVHEKEKPSNDFFMSGRGI